MSRIQMLNTKIDNYSVKETLNAIEASIEAHKQMHHVVVNAAKIVSMQSDLQLRQSVNESDLINADGQAVVWASRILGKPLKERVSGIDLMENLVSLAHKKQYKIFFLGAKETVVRAVVDKYSTRYSPNIIAGYRNGYFDKTEEESIANTISDSGAKILFVAMSSPIKENFLYDNKSRLNEVNFIMGVGGSFDVVSGKVKRSPVWLQKIGMEWFFRLCQEPKRMWKRYLVGNTKFILLVLKSKIFKDSLIFSAKN